MALHVYNPKTPYVDVIPGGIQAGMKILISGTPCGPQDCFAFNLQGGTNNEKGIVLHFMTRFNLNKVVRNTFDTKAWGKDESNGGLPFQKNQRFDIEVRISEHGYHISVNGKHFCDYKHRMSLEHATHLLVTDGVSIDCIRVEQTSLVRAIQGGLQPGMIVMIKGTPVGPDDSFAINLQGGYNNENGIALHFVPSFSKQKVRRNTCDTGGWGADETEGHFPFEKNKRFDMLVQVQENCYQISVNGQHFCNYNHRVPVNRATHLLVTEGVEIETIRVESPFPTGYPVTGELAPIYNPPVPFKKQIGNLYPGRIIFISGVPKLNGSRFSIYLDCVFDTAFVFDARFNYGNDRCQVVRNTQQNSAWGNEERDLPYFPFQQDMYFDMIILVEAGCFKVAVNNQHFLAYNHRVQPVNRVNTLRVEGDVKLCNVRFQ